MKISQSEARNLMLLAQGLHKKRRKKATKTDLLNAIAQMGQLQIDTISVVNRSPYLVLWSRLGEYDPKWLDELLQEKKIFEYWAHAACFLPIEDYPLYRRLMLDGGRRWRNQTQKWITEHPKAIKLVLDYINKNGETRSSDFKRTDGQKAGWWNWKEEKTALEVLFNKGDLMIARRQNFHRIYNLRERVLPDWDDTKAPKFEKVQSAQVTRAIKALGVATLSWIADYFYMPLREMPTVIEKLLNEQEVFEVEIENIGKAYIHKNFLDIKTLKPSLTTFLSPFDPLVNNRKRAKALFNFDYQIECYTPASKRKYGYFTLPILYKSKLIGRLDPKAHRKEKLFEIKAIYLEPSVKISDDLVQQVGKSIQSCAKWHGCPEVKIGKSNRSELKDLLQRRS